MITSIASPVTSGILISVFGALKEEKQLSVEAFVKENFDIDPQSNSDISSAKVICLGDPQHTSNLDEAFNSELLRLIARTGDVVLMERVPFLEFAKKREFMETGSVTSDIMVIGWDNVRLTLRCLEIARTLLDTVNTKQDADRLFAELDEAVKGRNKSMLSTINTVSAPCRIIVLAGRGHFTGDTELIDGIKRSKNSVVILSPKTRSFDDKNTIRKYFCGSFGDKNNLMLTIERPGRLDARIWCGFFESGSDARKGSTVCLRAGALSAANMAHFGLKEMIHYKIKDIESYIENISHAFPLELPPQF
ncbi:MAG: hypothetical protein WC527_00815 [Candidatus Margulisiibacteriota bacterium]